MPQERRKCDLCGRRIESNKKQHFIGSDLVGQFYNHSAREWKKQSERASVCSKSHVSLRNWKIHQIRPNIKILTSLQNEPDSIVPSTDENDADGNSIEPMNYSDLHSPPDLPYSVLPLNSNIDYNNSMELSDQMSFYSCVEMMSDSNISKTASYSSNENSQGLISQFSFGSTSSQSVKYIPSSSGLNKETSEEESSTDDDDFDSSDDV